MMHHNLAIIRGDRKNPTLRGPALEEYRQLYDYIRRLWSDREAARYGSDRGADAAMGEAEER